MKKTYVSPEAFVSNEVMEGVYMASGASTSDCWNVSGKSVQDWNGSHNVFEISAKHSSDVEHITSKVIYKITFNHPIVDAYSEFESYFNGSTVVVTRNLHANGYKSGDAVTFKVWAKANDEATTKSLAITNIDYKCEHSVNVQGKYD